MEKQVNFPMEYQNSRNKSSQFMSCLKSIYNVADDLKLALPCWMNSRKVALDFFGVNPSPSLNFVPSALRDAGKRAASCLPNFNAHPFLDATARVLTLGMYSGYQKGVAEFSQRQLMKTENYLCRDLPETEYMIELDERLISLFTDFEKFLEQAYQEEKSSVSNMETSENIPMNSPNFFSFIKQMNSLPEAESNKCLFVNFPLFLSWAKDLHEVLYDFNFILKTSLIPYTQLKDLQQISLPAKDADFLALAESLNNRVTSVNRRKSAARNKNASACAVSSLETYDNTAASSSFELAAKDDQRIAQHSESSDMPNINGMNKWFQQIHFLYSYSLEVAQKLLVLLSNEEFAFD